MAKVTKFEELVVWQEARKLHNAVTALCRKATFRNEYRLVAQMLAASRSVGANIAEGFERFTPGEFAHSLYIAKGEAGELRSFLYFAADEGRLTEAELKPLLARVESVGRLLGALRAAVARRKSDC